MPWKPTKAVLTLPLNPAYLSGESFLDAMLIISTYLDQFTGKKVEFSGFVHHNETMAENELTVARVAVTCCLADATVYGLLVRTRNCPCRIMIPGCG